MARLLPSGSRRSSGAASASGPLQSRPESVRLERTRRTFVVAGVVLLLYGSWLAAYFATGHTALDFVKLGRSFVLQSHASPLIKDSPNNPYVLPDGYDGQFNYYIALDPINARFYMDKPAYRYGRIVYPMLARVLALGQPAQIPYVLIVVNWLAIAGGTLTVALWLSRHGRSAWFALVYGLYPGFFIGLRRDLAEPLAYALVALAIYAFDYGGRRRVVMAGLAFALAALTRETTAVFAIVYGAWLLLQGQSIRKWRSALATNGRQAVLVLGLAGLPILLYKVFLAFWLGSAAVPADVLPDWIPFHGLFAVWPWTPFERLEASLAIVTVVVPALICLTMALWSLWRLFRVEIWALLVNVVVFVVLLNRTSYFEVYATQRVTAGVMLSALLCLPWLDQLTRRNHTWLLLAAVFWLLPDLLLIASG